MLCKMSSSLLMDLTISRQWAALCFICSIFNYQLVKTQRTEYTSLECPTAQYNWALLIVFLTGSPNFIYRVWATTRTKKQNFNCWGTIVLKSSWAESWFLKFFIKYACHVWLCHWISWYSKKHKKKPQKGG